MNIIEKINFVKSKIKRYGFFGIYKYIYIKYSAEVFQKTFLGKFKKIKGKNFIINFSKNNVAKALYLFPNLHDGDVFEIEKMLNNDYFKNRKDVLFVDLGANIGTISIPIAKVLKNKGKVISIEPHPKTFLELNKNIKLNNLENIQTLQIAVGEKNGLTNFSDFHFDDINKIENLNLKSKNILIPIMTLNDLLKEFERIDILKIDVEGYEKFVLENGLDILKKTKYIYIEYLEQNSNDYGYKRKEIKDILEKSGFDCTLSDPKIHQNPDIDNLICVNKNL